MRNLFCVLVLASLSACNNNSNAAGANVNLEANLVDTAADPPLRRLEQLKSGDGAICEDRDLQTQVVQSIVQANPMTGIFGADYAPDVKKFVDNGAQFPPFEAASVTNKNGSISELTCTANARLSGQSFSLNYTLRPQAAGDNVVFEWTLPPGVDVQSFTSAAAREAQQWLVAQQLIEDPVKRADERRAQAQRERQARRREMARRLGRTLPEDAILNRTDSRESPLQ